MICEKCAREEHTVRCETCEEEVVRLGPFCYHCGARLGEETREEEATACRPSENESQELDFSTRILCSDGACIGVVNDQGVCKVCGKPFTP